MAKDRDLKLLIGRIRSLARQRESKAEVLLAEARGMREAADAYEAEMSLPQPSNG